MISFQLPAEFEERLRKATGRDVADIAREALVVEGYKTGALSIGQAAEILDTSIDSALAIMKSHGVPMNYGIEDFEQDLVSLKKLFPEVAL